MFPFRDPRCHLILFLGLRREDGILLQRNFSGNQLAELGHSQISISTAMHSRAASKLCYHNRSSNNKNLTGIGKNLGRDAKKASGKS